MLRRVPPPRYQSNEGRLVDYLVEFGPTEGFPVDLWQFTLSKTYIPWSTWDAYSEDGAPRMPSTPPSFVRGTFALKTLPKEHERSLEDVTTRLRRETNVVQEQGWTINAYDRSFRFMSPAAVAAFEDMTPYLKDSGAYHWDSMKNILAGYVDSAGLDYARLSDPGYFEARRLDALNLWQIVDCVSQTLAAKWELGFGECAANPNPDHFDLPNTDEAEEVGGWMLNHFPSLRDGELPIPETRFVELYRVQLQPQEFIQNVDEMGLRFGPAAVTDLFGQVWDQKYGYEALLVDLERTLATPQELIGLGWLYTLRTLR